jgi:hypothetical protein
MPKRILLKLLIQSSQLENNTFLKEWEFLSLIYKETPYQAAQLLEKVLFYACNHSQRLGSSLAFMIKAENHLLTTMALKYGSKENQRLSRRIRITSS